MDIEAGSSVGETLAAIVITNELSQTQDGAHNAKVCANCGTSLTGAYCHACGQSSHIHRSLLHMVEELLHGLFHFDTKAWRTIPALIFRPGQLTREYIAGKRTSYVSPLALFLFLIFFMFFVFSYTMNDPGDDFVVVSNSREELVADIATAKSSLDQLQVQATKKQPEQEPDSDLPERIHDSAQQVRMLQDKLNDLDDVPVNMLELEAEIARLKVAIDEFKTKDGSDHNAISQQKRFLESDLRYAEKRLRRVVKRDIKGKTKQSLKSALKTSSSSASAEIKANVTAVASAEPAESDTDNAHFKASDLPEFPTLGNFLENADKDRKFTLYKMKKNAASLAFLLIPISLPFLWLLFAFRRQYVMFDHAVFSLYSLSFISVLLTVIAILSKLDFTGTAVLLFTFVPPIHMFSQLRNAYQLTKFEALWRTIALLFIAFSSLLAYAMVVTLFST